MMFRYSWDDDNDESIDPEAWAEGYNMDADEFEKFCEDHNITVY